MLDQVTLSEDQKRHQKRWDTLSKEAYDHTLATDRPVLDALDEIHLKYCKGDILEIGCGAGRFLDRLQQRGMKSFVGADISMGMLRGAASKGFQKLVNAPGESLPFGDKQFDSVVATFSVFKYIDRERGHAEVMRVLRPNGYFVFDLLTYWPEVIDHVWWNFLRNGKLPPRGVRNEYRLTLNMRNARQEVERAVRAGFRLVEMKSVRYLPFLRGRVQKLGYWPGFWGAKLGCNTIFVFQKGSEG